MKYRGRVEIVYDVLRSIGRETVNKRHVIGEANLPATRLEEVLKWLSDEDLIEIVSTKKKKMTAYGLKLTKKGVLLLFALKVVFGLLGRDVFEEGA